METWKIGIIEDDAADQTTLQSLLEAYFATQPQEEGAWTCMQGNEPLTSLCRMAAQCDLLFLDMQLGKHSGIEIGQQLRKAGIRIPIVIWSSHNRYLADGYTIGAFRYLLKSCTQSHFFQVMADLQREYFRSMRCIQDPRVAPRAIYYDEIVFIESQFHKTFLHLQNGEILAATYPMRHWIALLGGDGFERPSQSYLVHLLHVRTLSRYEVELDNGTVLPLSRTYGEHFRQGVSRFQRSRL